MVSCERVGLNMIKINRIPFVRFPILLAGLLLLGLLKLIRPLIRVRIGRLMSERVGHLAANTEVYLRRRVWKTKHKREYHLFVTGYAANRQLLNMIQRKVRVVDNPILLWMHDLVRSRTKASPTWIKLPMNSNEYNEFNDVAYNEFNDVAAQLSFTAEEEEKGRQVLSDIGVERGRPFVCFHARDKAYLDTQHCYRSRGEWAYHDYRDCDVNNYIASARYLATEGIYAIRMGYVVEKALPVDEARIIDYATHHRSDFGDIYLSARCKFFLASEGGLSSVPWIFDVPVAYSNGSPPGGIAAWRRTDVFIPKKLWSLDEKRFLSFRETLSIGADRWLETSKFQQANLEVVENTSEEILALTRELNERLNGTWVPQEEDEELQALYRILFTPSHKCYGFPSRIGAEFLRQNRNLLD